MHLSPPHLAGDELDRLREVLDSGWIAPAGPAIAAFESAVAAATGFQHVLATASGTAALHLAYRVLDIGPGDEVFWASPAVAGDALLIRSSDALYCVRE